MLTQSDYAFDDNSKRTFFSPIGAIEVPERSECDLVPLFNPATGKVWFSRCGKRSCPRCAGSWANKWRYVLATNSRWYPADRALTLTFAVKPTLQQFSRALEYLWQCLERYSPTRNDGSPYKLTNKATGRKVLYRPYHKPEYFGVVEFNKAQTLPHIHLILRDSQYIPQSVWRACWEKAQRMAGLRHIAFNVRIEAIKGGTDRYFTKYVTKGAGKGDKGETPPPSWGGRGIRQSRKFLHIPARFMLAAKNVQDLAKRGALGFVRPLIKEIADFEHAVADYDTAKADFSPILATLASGDYVMIDPDVIDKLGWKVDKISTDGELSNCQSVDTGFLYEMERARRYRLPYVPKKVGNAIDIGALGSYNVL